MTSISLFHVLGLSAAAGVSLIVGASIAAFRTLPGHVRSHIQHVAAGLVFLFFGGFLAVMLIDMLSR